MNRIIVHLGGGETRRQREHKRLMQVASQLEESIGLDDVVSVGSCWETDDSDPYLTLTVVGDWHVDHEQTATEEICECLEELAGKLTAAAARLKGGAA